MDKEHEETWTITNWADEETSAMKSIRGKT